MVRGVRLLIPGLLAWALLAVPPRIQAQAQRPRDAAGWTIFRPAPSTRLLYVSSQGNDASARAYKAGDPAVGADPFHPSKNLSAFRSIGAALKFARPGNADWVLLRRGDAWTENKLVPPSGRSEDEPALLGAYGDGHDRPQVRVGYGPGIAATVRAGSPDPQHFAIVGLEFTAHARDPGSPEFKPNGPGGKPIPDKRLSYLAGGDGLDAEGILIEDCCFRFLQVTIQARNGASLRGVVVRRNLFLDNYSGTGGYSQAYFSFGVNGLTIEECIFDHNGWSEDPRTLPQGKATVFNHDIYASGCSNLTIRHNLFLRSASLVNKIRSEDQGRSARILIEDNLYYGGEIPIGGGGNAANSYRYKDYVILNNVMTDVGSERPTKRRLALHMDLQDWDHGAVVGNLMVHNRNPEVWGCGAIALKGTARDVLIRDNVAWDLATKQPLLRFWGGADQERIELADNRFESIGSPKPILQARAPLSGFRFTNNLFVARGEAGPSFKVGDRTLDYAQWSKTTGDRPSVAKRADFPDPRRTLESYQASQGGKPGIAGLLEEVRQQSRARWREEYTAAAINDYLRAGFGLTRQPLPVGFGAPDPLPTRSHGLSRPTTTTAPRPRAGRTPKARTPKARTPKAKSTRR